MKYIITESRLNKFILDWLDENLTRIDYTSLPRVFFVRDNDGVMFHDKRNGYVNITNKIWRLLKQFFGLTNEEVHEITKEWVEECYNLDVNRMETESVYYPKGFNPKNDYEKLK